MALKTLSDLTVHVLPRLTQSPKTGMSILQAANSVQSIIYKRLLMEKSDLLASGQLDLVVPAYGNSAPLPSDFLSVAEKPRTEELFTDYMTGTITAYDSVNKIITVNSTAFQGTDTLSSWYLTVPNVFPTSPATIIGTSMAALTPQTGSLTFAIVPTPGITVPNSGNVTIGPMDLPDYLHPRHRHLQPEYLDEDYEHDFHWWTWYGDYGLGYEPLCNHPRHYKVIGSTIYVRPKVGVDVAIKGRYNQKPVELVLPTDTLPWSDFFYDVYHEGIVWIIAKGLSMPDADAEFTAFVKREIESLTWSRVTELPRNRTRRSVWL